MKQGICCPCCMFFKCQSFVGETVFFACSNDFWNLLVTFFELKVINVFLSSIWSTNTRMFDNFLNAFFWWMRRWVESLEARGWASTFFRWFYVKFSIGEDEKVGGIFRYFYWLKCSEAQIWTILSIELFLYDVFLYLYIWMYLIKNELLEMCKCEI